MMDGNAPLPNGSILGYDVATFSQYNPPGTSLPLYFPITPDPPNSNGGGVWQDGGGLAYGPDDNGTNALYFNTANGAYDGTANFGDSFMKLTTGLSFSASFTPGDQAYRSCLSPYNDQDFGSGAPILTPSNSKWPSIAVSAEKEGYIWVMDRLSPGGYNSLNTCPSNCANSCTLAQQGNSNLDTLSIGGLVQNTPAYWFGNTNNNEYIFLADARANAGVLGRFELYPPSYACPGGSPPLCNQTGVPATGPNGAAIKFSYGTTPSVSAVSSTATDSIVWAINKADGGKAKQGTDPGTLYAFDALTMSQLYSSSNSCSGDAIGPATKYSVPTIANGFVYVAGAGIDSLGNAGLGTLYIFGLNRTCH
jgi:hypothetical protein